MVEVVEGGLIIDFGALAFQGKVGSDPRVAGGELPRGFLPALEADERGVGQLDHLGKTLECKVIEWDRSRNHLILSRRAVLEEQERERRDAEDRRRREEEKQIQRRTEAEERRRRLREELAARERDKQKVSNRVQPPRPTLRDERNTAERRELRDKLDDAAATLGPVAERCLTNHYGRTWLSNVNARRKGEHPPLREFKPGEVRDDPRAALWVIGRGPALKAAFGPAQAKARHLKNVADRLHHANESVGQAELVSAHRKLHQLCEIARRILDA